MPWFKVDDGLAFHPKVLEAGNAAMGLWVRAGAWCSAHLTEGALPKHMIGTLGAQSRDAKRLVESGLWEQTDVGFQFCDWAEYQPTKKQVETDREANRERQRRFREKRRNDTSDAATNGGSNGVTNGETNSPPSRPDPTNKEKTSSPDAPATVHDLSARAAFDEFWEHYPRKVAKDGAKKAFAKAAKNTDVREIVEGARRFGADPNLPEDKSFIPHATTWLNRGSWEDEPLPSRSAGMWAGSATRPDAPRDSKSGLLVER